MKLRVGHHDYSLVALPEDDDDFGQIAGDCCRPTLTIRVDLTAPPTDQADTLLHEALHAIWQVYGLPAKVTEEEAATRLAGPLLALLRDNPEVVKAVLGTTAGVPLKLPDEDDD